jgi:histidyl-tRNA synthetase
LIGAASNIAQALRQTGIITDLYGGSASIKKQLAYANKKGIQTAVLLMEEGLCLLKQLDTGHQIEMNSDHIETIIRFINHEGTTS